MLTAIKETKHTVTTSEGKTIHKKLASKPVKFQLWRKPEEKRRPTNKCRRCGKFCQGEICDTHKRVYGIPKGQQEPCSRRWMDSSICVMLEKVQKWRIYNPSWVIVFFRVNMKWVFICNKIMKRERNKDIYTCALHWDHGGGAVKYSLTFINQHYM